MEKTGAGVGTSGGRLGTSGAIAGVTQHIMGSSPGAFGNHGGQTVDATPWMDARGAQIWTNEDHTGTGEEALVDAEGRINMEQMLGMGFAPGMEDTMQFETLLANDALRAYTMERARLIGDSGAIPYLIGMCCGPAGPLEDKQNPPPPPEPGAKKKKAKKKKVPNVPGTDDGQRYATGCLRVLSMEYNYRAEMMRERILRYIAPLMMSKNQKARWHARHLVLTLSQDEENMPILSLYVIPPKKKLHWKTCDGVPEFIAMTNVKRYTATPSKAPEMLYGDTHKLALTAKEIREWEQQRRVGKSWTTKGE